MDKRGQEGAITVFLSIILLCLVILTGIIIDGVRIRAANVHVKGALDSAVMSILSDYDDQLKNEYGIFALNTNDLESIKQLDMLLGYYLNRSFQPQQDWIDEGGKGNDYLDFYGFNIENLRILYSPQSSLLNKDATKYQIMEYMKYRAPVQLGEEFLEKLDMIKRVGNTAKLLKKKVQVEEALETVGDLQEKLYMQIYGRDKGREIGNTQVYVNQFYQDIRVNQQSFDEYCTHITRYAFLLKQREEKEKQIAQKEIEITQEEMQQEENEEEEEIGESDRLKELKRELRRLEDEHKEIKKDIQYIAEKLQFQCNQLQNTLNQYHKINIEAQKTIQELFAKSQEARRLNDELKNGIDQVEDVMDPLKKNMEKDSRRFEEHWGKGSTGDYPDSKLLELGNRFKSNEEIVHQLIKELTKIEAQKIIPWGYEEIERIEMGKIQSSIDSLRKEYDGQLEYKYPYISKEEAEEYRERKKLDNRQESSEKANELLTYDDNHNVVIDEEIFQKLPSQQGIEKEMVPVDFESKTGKTTFLLRTLDFLIEFPRMIENMAFTLREEVYVNEYCMGTFRNAVSFIEGNPVPSDPVLRQGQYSKHSREGYLDYELEYLLNGSPNQNRNLMITKSEIIMYRFGLNLIHVYSDPEKSAIATSVATAVAGWWTAGAAVPILKTMIMCGWAMGESIIDVEKLMKGNKIPFYKTKSDWILGINGLTNQIIEKKTYEFLDDAEKWIQKTQDFIEQQMDLWLDNAVDLALHNLEELEQEIEENHDNILQRQLFLMVKDKFHDGINKTRKEIEEIKRDIRRRMQEVILQQKEELQRGIVDMTQKGRKEIQQFINDFLRENQYTTHDQQFNDCKMGLLDFSYYDYLRICLLFRRMDTIISRILDLIQLNMNQEVKHFYVMLGAEIDVTIKYLFLSQPFMPKDMKFKNNRHRISERMYRGY